MSPSIPASQLVNVIPGVLGAGGNPLALNAIFLTSDTSIPIGAVQAFSTLEDVQDWFGASSNEADDAAVYFAGFAGATQLPGTLYFVQYNSTAVAGYLRGASVAGVTLAQLQALSGTITLSIDGVSTVSAAINLSGATSQANAAALIQTGLRAGTPGNTVVVTYDSQLAAFKVTSPTTGATSTISVAATSSLATGLKLTAAAGAVTSAGAAIAVPATLMGEITDITQNWATFMSVDELTVSAATPFAAWVNTANQRFAYVAQFTASSDAITFGNATATYDGVITVCDSTGKIAAFICGTTASINFSETNGRITYAYKSQPGLPAEITSATLADNLTAAHANFYGAYATANEQFTFLQTGQISGDWLWIDSYINQIYLNSQLQLAFMELLSNVKSIPYNQQGYNLLRAAAQDPINEALNFGSIRAGVALSASQIAQVNTAAGFRISDTLQQQGWYLKVGDATAQVRSNRDSPPMTLWYVDGESVQKLTLSSIDVQ